VKRASRAEETRTVRFGDTEVMFRLRRSDRRRRAGLQVDEKGLTVSLPWRFSEQRLDTLLRESESWVLRNLAAWTRHLPPPLTWRSGDTLHYLGEALTLEVASARGRPRAARLHERMLITVPNPCDTPRVQRLAVKWLRAQALEVFAGHAARLAPRLGLAPPRVFLSSATTRWGSCNGTGSIRVNWRLVQAREALIEYVVAHELAHFHEMNHGARFWAHVARVCPDHRARRTELNVTGRRLLLMPVS
jgi:predicted metal-dependent hydrolase